MRVVDSEFAGVLDDEYVLQTKKKLNIAQIISKILLTFILKDPVVMGSSRVIISCQNKILIMHKIRLGYFQ